MRFVFITPGPDAAFSASELSMSCLHVFPKWVIFLYIEIGKNRR